MTGHPMDPYGPSVLTIQVHPQAWEKRAKLDGFASVVRWLAALTNRRASVDPANPPQWR